MSTTESAALASTEYDADTANPQSLAASKKKLTTKDAHVATVHFLQRTQQLAMQVRWAPGVKESHAHHCISDPATGLEGVSAGSCSANGDSSASLTPCSMSVLRLVR